MSYTDEIDLLTLFRSSSVPTVLIQEWEGIHQYDNAGHDHWHETNLETVTVPFSVSQNFTMSSGPSATLPGYSIGIRVLWSSPIDPGPLFRSGYFQTLPAPKPASPTGQIDIIEAPLQSFTEAQIATSLPTLPFALDPMNTITALPVPTITPTTVGTPGTINVVAVGTSTGFGSTTLGAPVTFTYTAPVLVSPSNKMDETGPPTEVVIVSPKASAATLTFSSTGSWMSALEAFLGNLLIGLFMPKVNQAITIALSKLISDKAIAAAAQLAGGSSTATTLPPGVVLSATRVTVGTVGGVSGIHVVPALGMYGPLIKTLFPGGTAAGSSKCPVHLLVFQAGLHPVRLQTFRTLRDQLMSSGEQGAKLVELYYLHASEMAMVLASNPLAAARTAAALQSIGADLERNRVPSPQAIAKLRRTLVQVAPFCSQALHDALLKTVGEIA